MTSEGAIQEPTPASMLADILDAPAFTEMWRRYHFSRADENPAHVLAEDIRAGKLESDPDLVAFLREMIDIERLALGVPSEKDSAEITSMRDGLEAMARYVASLMPAQLLPPRKKLPASSQDLLDILEKETAQTEFTPVSYSWNFIKNMWLHIYEDAKKRKIQSGLFLTLSLATLGFMNSRLGTSSTIYTDPEDTTIVNFSLDEIDSDKPFQRDPSVRRNTSKQACHDHVLNLTHSKVVADWTTDTFGDDVFFARQCNKMKTLARDANGMYNWMNGRLGVFTKDRVLEVGKTLPTSHFVRGYKDGADTHSEFVYEFDWVENITIHSILLLYSMRKTYKYGTMDNEEWRETKATITDFFNRTRQNVPLSYPLTLAGTTAAFMHDGGVNTTMIWGALAGSLAGQGLHTVWRRHNRADHVQNIILPAHDRLTQFAYEPTIVIPDVDIISPAALEGRWKKKLAAAFVPAAALGSLVVADARGVLDALPPGTMHNLAVNASYVAGWIIAGGMVDGSYLAVNVPQDAAFHTIIIMLGAAAGGGGAGLYRGGKGLANIVKGKRSEPMLISGIVPEGDYPENTIS